MTSEETRQVEQADQGAGSREGKYLTFSLAGEEYGIGILKVKEIIGLMTITRIPQAPDYVKGMINLRGKVIPVIDLRLKFCMEAIAYTERTCIIVVEVRTMDRTMKMGIIVDSVSEVLNIKNGEIEDMPSFGKRLDTDNILGVAKVAGGIKILLDIDGVLSESDFIALADAA